jgi:hypothetical protein
VVSITMYSEIFNWFAMYEVGSKQYETRQIFQQLRPVEELCKNKNYRLLYKPQVAFSFPTSPAIGLGSSAGDRQSLQALRPGPHCYRNHLSIVILHWPDQEGE